MNPLQGAISIKDNATSVLRSIRKEQSAFRSDVQKTKAELQRTWDKKYQARLDATAATKTISSLKKRMEPLRKKIVTVASVKDIASEKVKKIASQVKKVGKLAATPVIKLKDMASVGLGKIGSKVKSIAKKMVIPVTVAATVATAALGGTVTSGMQLENQQTSIQHFIGATNEGMNQSQVKTASDTYLSQLRENANTTPFETGDVINAGARAISVASGNTESAMSLVRMAEDMAAASGGTKTIGDAMEALADAKMGEMERLKEFGFKISAEEFQSKGFEGVSADLQSFFGGAAEKLAATGSGLMSTIKGKLKSNVADMGLKIVEKLKPALSSVIDIIDKAGPAMASFGSIIADKIGSGIQFITEIIPALVAGFQTVQPIISSITTGFAAILPQLTSFGSTLMAAIQQVDTAAIPVTQTISTISNVISAAAPIINGLVEGIGIAVSALAPVFQVIFDGIGQKVGSVLSFVGERMGWIQEILRVALPTVSSILRTAWSVISPIIDIAISVFQVLYNVTSTVFRGIVSVISDVWSVIQPIVEGIANGLSWIADKISGLFGFGGGGGGSVGENANGTNNWKGGLTWVGERGPELVELPGGSRILPTKESINFASGVKNAAVARAVSPALATQPSASAVSQASDSVIQNTTVINHTSAGAEGGVINRIVSGFSAIISLFRPKSVPKESGSVGQTNPPPPPPPSPWPNSSPPTGWTSPERQKPSFVVNINKLADQLVVRNDEDIDRIGEALARRFIEVAGNMV